MSFDILFFIRMKNVFFLGKIKLMGTVQMKKEWIVNKTNKKDKKSLIERLLATRGITKPEEIKEFLAPLETTITHPNAFTDMTKAVNRLTKALENKEKILIYGDFDADGVTSTALLYRTLLHLNFDVDYFIPDREKDGHGLNSKALVKLMATKKPKLIITCDCAISDVEQVQFINSFKIDVIITDHHEAPEILPSAYAIINPKAQNSLDEKLSAKEIEFLSSLAGVGVAFKLAQALLEEFNKLDFVYDILPYVAVGTISDVVPLIGENRYFVTKGLQLISEGKHYGLKRLLESAGYVLEQGITSEQIAFGVAPRINASGRLDTTEDALKVLISDNKQEIEMSIISLNNFNKIRQELCESIFLEAEEMLKREGNNQNSIILYGPKWHIGIIGIVASKLVEKYYKPTFLMTYSEETKQIRCSSRSVEGVNIYDVLSANAEMFDGFGGHSMAGGLSFDAEKVTFEEVKNAINKTINEILDNKKLHPVLKIDLEVEPNEVDGNLISDIERLQPFGAANPNPIFAMYNLTLLQKKLMGSNKNHLKLVVEDSQHNTFDCIWWSKGDISLVSGDILDIAFCPQTNTYNGSTSIQLILQDIHADNLADEKDETETPDNGIKMYDHRKKKDIYSSVEDYVKTSNLNIKIFAEDRQILEKLKPYKSLSENIINRLSISEADSIILFDYPANQVLLDEIIEKSKPKFIHFMNYEIKNTDEKDLAKTFLGMLKYAHNNRNGIFEISRSAAFLAQTEETIHELINIFENADIVKGEFKDNCYKIKTFNSNDISKILHTIKYKTFIELISETQDFKNTLQEIELSEVV